MVYLKSENYNRFYLGKLLSFRTAFSIFMWVIAFSFAFFLAFSTDNMWLRDEFYVEQPTVQARSEALIYVLQDGQTSSYSTVAWVNNQFSNQLSGASVSSLNIDNDMDGKTDLIQTEITFTADSLSSVRLYLFFDYGLRSLVKVQMQDFLQFDIGFGVDFQKAYISGTISLNQKSPLRSGSTIMNSSNINFFANAMQNVNAQTLKQNKTSRNNTIDCDYTTTISPNMFSGTAIQRTITVSLLVPKDQIILFVPGILENLKLSWILYLAFLIPLYLIIDKVLKFTYRNRLFRVKVLNDLPRSAIDNATHLY